MTVELLDHPQTQEFTALAVGDPIRIRYDQVRDAYEVKVADRDWLRVIDNPDSTDMPNTQFRIATDPAEPARFSTFGHYRFSHQPSAYHYSNLADWHLGPEADQKSGKVAFGTPTPAGHIPVAGSASYAGAAEGHLNLPNAIWGEPIADTPVGGKVRLIFDFASAGLTGSLQLGILCDCDKWIDQRTFEFTDTTFARGSTTFGGRFLSDVTGANSFSGLFTGPNAEELIGQWTVPILHDGKTYSATGGWIAKPGN
jgi:hypothetical protein